MFKKNRKPEKQHTKIGSQPKDSQQGKTVSIIYGIEPVREMLRADARRIKRLLVCEGGRKNQITDLLSRALALGVEAVTLHETAFTKLVGSEAKHQSIAAEIEAIVFADFDEILEKSALPLIVIADEIEDPRNLGAILRSAEGAGADCVVVPERRSAPLSAAAIKASAGAAFHIPIVQASNINNFIAELKKRNIWVVGADAGGDKNYDEWDWLSPTAIVVGSEGRGLRRLTAELCDVLLKIPLSGKIESLNVSVAAAVLLFEAQRQRLKRQGLAD